MSIWVRAICTKSVADVSPEDLRAGVAERLSPLSVLYGEPDDPAAAAHLRVEQAGAEGPFDVYRLRYRPEDDRSLRVERLAAPRARNELEALARALDDCEEEDVDVVRQCLEGAVEAVTIELSMSDTQGIGWPVAIAAAAYLADRGEGLVQADGEGWMAPRGRGVEQVIDAD